MPFLKFYKDYLLDFPRGLISEWRYVLKMLMVLLCIIIPLAPYWFVSYNNISFWFPLASILFIFLVTMPVLQYCFEE